MSKEKQAVINSKDAQVANLQAVDNKDAKVDKVDNKDAKVAKKSKRAALKFDNTYQAVALNSIEFKVAERLWWYKTSDKNVANLFDIDMDKLQDAIYTSDKFKQSLFNLLCVQWDNLASFENWMQSFPKPGINITLSKRFKVDIATIKAMLQGAKKHYSNVASGANVKVMKQRVNPRAIGNNNRNGNSS